MWFLIGRNITYITNKSLMVFSDLFFLFAFLPACALCYLLATIIDKNLFSREEKKSVAARNFTLVVFSLIFYAWGEPVYVLLLLLSVIVNFIAGSGIARQNNHRKLALVIGLVCNIAILGTFKYAGFFAQILNDVGLPVPDPKISLPIGISFYTFQSISYLVDVYRRDAHAQRRFIDLLLYISMFPQLIAGPIVRYGTVAREINDRHVTIDDFADGVFRFLIGLGKKVIIANQLSEIVDQFLKDGIGDLSTPGAYVGVLAFTLQIYFDFSGYSDMAIGMGRCLGFHFNENFNHPYCCNSITDFWRRWHMSLGTFFRDYVYIPMGGNRRHQVFNIMVVWFLTGMWHGASWNFIMWGVYFGVIVTLEKYLLKPIKARVPALFLHLYALILVFFGWCIFYFDDLGQMGICINALFGMAPSSDGGTVALTSVLNNFWLWVAALLFSMPVRHWVAMTTKRCLGHNAMLEATVFTSSRIVISIVLLGLSVALLVGATNNAFIYTRF